MNPIGILRKIRENWRGEATHNTEDLLREIDEVLSIADTPGTGSGSTSGGAANAAATETVTMSPNEAAATEFNEDAPLTTVGTGIAPEDTPAELME